MVFKTKHFLRGQTFLILSNKNHKKKTTNFQISKDFIVYLTTMKYIIIKHFILSVN